MALYSMVVFMGFAVVSANFSSRPIHAFEESTAS